MMGGLESFCQLQFMGKKASNNCQLAVEELVTGYILPALQKYPDKSVGLRIDAGEEGKETSMTVDVRSLLGTGLTMEENDEDFSLLLLHKLLKRQPDKEPGVVFFMFQ